MTHHFLYILDRSVQIPPRKVPSHCLRQLTFVGPEVVEQLPPSVSALVWRRPIWQSKIEENYFELLSPHFTV